MKSSLILGTVAALVSFAPAAAAKSPAEIEQIAKAVSVAYNQAISRDPKDAEAYYTPGRDTCNFAHIGLDRLHSNSLKVYYCTA
jgi:hypothetical protein